MGLWKCLWVKGGPLSGLCVWELPKSVYALFNALIKGSAIVELTIFTAGKHVKISRTTNIYLLFRIDPKRSILTSFQGLLGGSFGVIGFLVVFIVTNWQKWQLRTADSTNSLIFGHQKWLLMRVFRLSIPGCPPWWALWNAICCNAASKSIFFPRK